MRTIEQLKNDFSLYFQEIERCEHAKCYLALLHVLLALPDVCAFLEADPKEKVGDRYVTWCDAFLPKSQTVSGVDRYQMRNALLHGGSTTTENRGKHRTLYMHISYIHPETFGIEFHHTTKQDRRTLNVHLEAMVVETKKAMINWFEPLQSDSVKMSCVEQNIKRLIRIQPKTISQKELNGSLSKRKGLTWSST
jgi:hypothetical protein